ncbi:MAG TPA: hypothetical protein VGB37_12740 [Candidatus Lokiarchaeia archaeon]
MKKKTNESVFVLLASIMFLAGFGILIWSAISLSWLRLLIGIIFIFLSISYSYAWKKEKEK